MQNKPEQRGGRYAKSMASLLPKVTKAAMGKKSRAFVLLLENWPQIIGANLAHGSLPTKLTFAKGGAKGGEGGGTLHVNVARAFAMDFECSGPQIISRINQTLGYTAVARIKIVQADLPVSAPPVLRTAKSAKLPEPLKNEIQAVENEDLRASLQKLGSYIVAKS